VREGPPLVVLVLGGTAERWGTPAEASPLALAPTPQLDSLARDGRVLGVKLVEEETHVATAAPLLSILGYDPAEHETSPAGYLGAAKGEKLVDEECYCCADFISLFRETVADIEPGLPHPLPHLLRVLVRAWHSWSGPEFSSGSYWVMDAEGF